MCLAKIFQCIYLQMKHKDRILWHLLSVCRNHPKAGGTSFHAHFWVIKGHLKNENRAPNQPVVVVLYSDLSDFKYLAGGVQSVQ